MGLLDKIKGWLGIKKREKTYKEEKIEVLPEETIIKQRISEGKERYVKQQPERIEIKEPISKKQPKRTVTSVERQIDKDILNKYNFESYQQNGLIAFNSNTIQHNYEKLLQGKVTDSKLKEDMIKHSDLLIRKRISADVQLTGEEGTKTIITIIGMLPEDETQVNNYWQGKVIYNDINTHCQDFIETMRSQGMNVRGCVPKSGNPIGKLTVNNVRGEVTFK